MLQLKCSLHEHVCWWQSVTNVGGARCKLNALFVHIHSCLTVTVVCSVIQSTPFVTQTNMTIVIETKKVTIEILNVGLFPLVLRRNTSKTEEPLTKGRRHFAS